MHRTSNTMDGGWRYRLVSVLGAGTLAFLAVAVANNPLVQTGYRLLPVIGHLPFDPPGAVEFAIEAGTTVVVVVGALFPLYKPRPRRILDVAMLSTQRTLVALFTLAGIGYFDYTYRLPRATMVVAGAILVVAIPAWFVTIRRRPGDGDRTVLVGDDPVAMDKVLGEIDGAVLGYVSPPTGYEMQTESESDPVSVADGGQVRPRTIDDLGFLGGFSRLDDVLIDYDVDTAVLAFRHADRGEFFGALDTCYEHGVTAKVHRDHADRVLTGEDVGEKLVRIDLEPWDWQDYVLKRAFDVAFAAGTLLFMSPLLAIIGLAIKLQDGGPILYRQERTAEFGQMFTIYKFRSMTPDDEDTSPDSEEDYRVTRVGRVLRKTHLDEIPQLWTILTGKMSVVGPRAVWTEEEIHLEEETAAWRKRWFIKPGLTGVAQINDATSTDAKAKLRYDLEYIRRQSFWFDLRIVIRQVWKVFDDFVHLLKRGILDRVR